MKQYFLEKVSRIMSQSFVKTKKFSSLQIQEWPTSLPSVYAWGNLAQSPSYAAFKVKSIPTIMGYGPPYGTIRGVKCTWLAVFPPSTTFYNW